MAGMLAAGISALVTNVDCDDSKINRSNSIIGTAKKAAEYIDAANSISKAIYWDE
ncbi:hypothetical protein [Geosporobacter ferrireducens]|uniref:hypothetical protein n=1 Tax=Geosporobacter ferrireducens TaxID=1424294 RepID=UPI0012EA67FA|nr:hypothetical protein [Geosporobacter ferrireducens]